MKPSLGSLMRLALASLALALPACGGDALVMLKLVLPAGLPAFEDVELGTSDPSIGKRTLHRSALAEHELVGYYVPGGRGTLTITARALRRDGCLVGQGSTRVPALEPGVRYWAEPIMLAVPAESTCARPRGDEAPAVSDGGVPNSGPIVAPIEAGPPRPTTPGAIVWQTDIGEIAAVARDSQGHLAVAGTVQTAGMDLDILLGRYNAAGERIWRKTFGGPSKQAAMALALADDDTLVVTGAFHVTTDFGGQSRTAEAGMDVFVAAYTADGDLRRLVNFGGFGDEMGAGVLVDGSTGEWIVTGATSSNFVIGPVRVVDSFVARLRPDGAVVWADSGGGVSITALDGDCFAAGLPLLTARRCDSGQAGVKTDIGAGYAATIRTNVATGELVVSGGFVDVMVLGQRFSSMGPGDAFVAGLDPRTGRPSWFTVVAKSPGEDDAHGVCTTAAGEIYVVGAHGGDSGLGPVGPTGVGVFVARYDRGGKRQWAAPVPGATRATGVVCDDPDGIVIATDKGLVKVVP